MLDTGWSFINKSVIRQYFAAFIVNLYIVQFGILEGWASPMNILLTSEDTPLPSGKISIEESSWITSLLSLGAFFSNLVFGFIVKRFGRKMPLFWIGIPMIITWALIWFAQNPVYLYVARFSGGFLGGSAYMVVPIFLTEIADDSIRGAFLSSVYASESLGFLLAYVIGNYFGYYAMPLFSIILIAIYTVFLFFLPEVPIYLVQKNNVAQAKKSICFYKNKNDAVENEICEIELEMDKIKRILDQNSKTVEDNGWTPEKIAIARKAIIIAIVLVLLYMYSGIMPMFSYVATIFEDTGSNLSPNTSAIIIGVIQLLGTCIATDLVERLGRKVLLLTSCFGTALSLGILGVYMMLKTWGIHVEVVSFVPLVSFSAATFLYAIGIQALALSVIYEFAPEKIKEAYITFSGSFLWMHNFISTKYLPMFFDLLTFSGGMYFFAGVCVLSAIFIVFYVPETKNKSYEEIMESLSPKKLRKNVCCE